MVGGFDDSLKVLVARLDGGLDQVVEVPLVEVDMDVAGLTLLTVLVKLS